MLLDSAIASNLCIKIGLAMREHGRGLDGQTVGRRVQTSCGRRRRERGWHGAWLTRRAGTSRPSRRTGGQTCKPTAQIEPKYK